MARPWRVALALALGIAVLAGIVVIHKLTRDSLDQRGHYQLKIADLKVEPPPGMSREAFLDEVIYTSRLPATLDRTDPTARVQLHQAFASHPWVESVTVGELSDPQPVTLTFRTPTLVVGNRVVDRLGVLLPLPTKKEGLPVFRGAVKEAATPSGQVHPDAVVVSVAKTIAWLRLQLPDFTLQAAEMTGEGLVLVRQDGAKAVWGFSKGSEPTAEKKVERLKAWKEGTVDLKHQS